MAEFKRQTFQLSTGKQIKLYGNSFFINKSLEIGEGLAPSIFRLFDDPAGGDSLTTVANPYRLTADELQELADYNIRLWLDLKDSIRKHGIDNPRAFNRDDIKVSDVVRSGDFPKKERDKTSRTKEKGHKGGYSDEGKGSEGNTEMQ